MATILNPNFALVLGNIDHWLQGLSVNWSSAPGAVGVSANYTAPASFGDNFIYQSGVFTDFGLGTTYTVNVTVRNVPGFTGTADVYFGNVSVADIVGTVSALSPGLHVFTGIASSDVIAIASVAGEIVIERCEIIAINPEVIISPNSFVQISEEFLLANPDTGEGSSLGGGVINCVPEIPLCYPVYEPIDIGFQFICITGGTSYNYYLDILKDGMPVGTQIPLSKIEIVDSSIDPIFPCELVLMTGLGSAGFETELEDGDCFSLRVSAVATGDPIVLFETNCFTKITDKCWTSAIYYRGDDNSFGFYYFYLEGEENLLEGFQNCIRLPFYLTAPQYPEKDNVFLKSNGQRKLLSSRIDQEWQVKTDYMPRQWHEHLIVARSHDTFRLENINTRITGPIQYMKNGAYEIDWLAFLDHPVAQAKFKLLTTPYYNVNSNCR